MYVIVLCPKADKSQHSVEKQAGKVSMSVSVVSDKLHKAINDSLLCHTLFHWGFPGVGTNQCGRLPLTLLSGSLCIHQRTEELRCQRTGLLLWWQQWHVCVCRCTLHLKHSLLTGLPPEACQKPQFKTSCLSAKGTSFIRRAGVNNTLYSKCPHPISPVSTHHKKLGYKTVNPKYGYGL